MNYSKKQIQPLMEKYSINVEKDKAFAQIIGLFEDQTPYQVWALKAYYNGFLAVNKIKAIKTWIIENDSEIKNLIKGNIISYKNGDDFVMLFREFEGLDLLKLVKTAVNKFNTKQRKMLSSRYLDHITNGLEAFNSTTLRSIHTTFKQFLMLPLNKQENIINLASAIENSDFLYQHISSSVNASYDWNKEDMLSYLSRKANDCNVVYENNDVVVITVPTFKSSKTLCGNGRTGWCLTREERYFNQYVRDVSESTQYFLFDFSKREDHELAHIGFTVRKGRGIVNAHSTKNNNLLGDGIRLNNKMVNIHEALKMAQVPKGVYSPLNKLQFVWNYDNFKTYLNERKDHLSVAYDKDNRLVVHPLTHEGFIMLTHFTLIDMRNFPINDKNSQYVLFDFNKQAIDDNSCIIFSYVNDAYGTKQLNRITDSYNQTYHRNIFDTLGVQEIEFLSKEKVEEKILLHKYIDSSMVKQAIDLLSNHNDFDVNFEFNASTPISKAINMHLYDVAEALISHPKFDINVRDAFGEPVVQSLMYIYLTTSNNNEKNKMKSLITWALNKGFNLNDTNINGDTVINCACEDVAYLWIVEKLISNNDVDLNVVNDINCTALGNAIRKRNVEAIKLLARREDVVIRSTDMKLANNHGIDLHEYFDNLDGRIVETEENIEEDWAIEFLNLLK